MNSLAGIAAVDRVGVSYDGGRGGGAHHVSGRLRWTGEDDQEGGRARAMNGSHDECRTASSSSRAKRSRKSGASSPTSIPRT